MFQFITSLQSNMPFFFFPFSPSFLRKKKKFALSQIHLSHVNENDSIESIFDSRFEISVYLTQERKRTRVTIDSPSIRKTFVGEKINVSHRRIRRLRRLRHRVVCRVQQEQDTRICRGTLKPVRYLDLPDILRRKASVDEARPTGTTIDIVISILKTIRDLSHFHLSIFFSFFSFISIPKN